MDAFRFSLFLLALPVLMIALYPLFIKKEKEQEYLKPLFYFLLVVSAIVVIWGIISIIMALVSGIEIEVRKPSSILFIAAINCFTAFSQDINYDEWFTGERMRVDLFYSGNHETTQVFFKKIKKEPVWGGTRTNLLDPMGFGHFQVMIYDKETNWLLFSRGFSTLWEEWQTTAESKITYKSMIGSVKFPYPKKEVV